MPTDKNIPEICDRLLVLLNNAITYMYEQNMSTEDIADYLGSSEEELDAINENDIDGINI